MPTQSNADAALAAAAAAGGPWRDVTAADFQELDPAVAPNESPNNLVTAALTVAAGVITIQTTEDGTGTRETIPEADCFPMVPPPEFDAGGTWGITWELEQTSVPTALTPIVAFGVCDNSGSPAAAGKMFAGGIRALNVAGQTITTALPQESSCAAAAVGGSYTTCKAIVVWTPNGATGMGQIECWLENSGAFVDNTYFSASVALTAMTGDVVPIMIVCWNSTGADSVTITMKVRVKAFKFR